MGSGEKDILTETIGGLANGPHDIVAKRRGGRSEVFDGMNGLIEGGAEQVVHPGIDNDETFGGVFFDIKDAGNERTALTDKRTAKFEVELLTGIEA